MTDSLTFIGTATTVIRLGRFTILTDPNFLRRGQRAYLGKGLWSKRLTEPALSVDQLPPLDAVLLSHLHGDHFDRVARRGLDRDGPVMTTPHAARRLDRWGFETHAMRTWETTTLGDEREAVRVTSLPAVHAHGVMGALLPPVMGTMLELERRGQTVRRIYVSGDTLTGDHLNAIAERFPTIDDAVVHLGGTRVLMQTVTMDDRQGIDCLRRIEPRHVLPVHHDDYGVFRSPLTHFLERARGEGLGDVVTPIARGQTVELATPR
jgi:L-ascorbate metabolism protein UlaG (beta-lactamase superfamily)